MPAVEVIDGPPPDRTLPSRALEEIRAAVRRQLAQRQVVLGAVTILAIAVALAFTTRHDAHHHRVSRLPRHTAATRPSRRRRRRSALGRRTSCGVLVGDATMGIGSPVLPCGARLYLTYRHRHVLASVIDRADAPGASLVLTHALARRLGVSGVRRVRWAYAGA